jgi:aldehyde dehydrogenase (NAD+)
MAELEHRGDRTPAPSAWEYATAPESRDIVTLEERYGLFIGGQFIEPRSGEYYATIDPSSEEPLA